MGKLDKTPLPKFDQARHGIVKRKTLKRFDIQRGRIIRAAIQHRRQKPQLDRVVDNHVQKPLL
jgi:hypothetical protein